jgi:pimeloyl-ACP methyl ester carboxylesterase
MGRILRSALFAGVVLGAMSACLAVEGPSRPTQTGPQVHRTTYLSARASIGEVESRPLVWVLDGAGDLRGCSNALANANLMAGNPMDLSVFAWSHGYRQLLLDQRDTAHAKAQGARLAAKIAERSRQEPGRRVVVVAHSAGAAVALAAGDVLPPDAIDRVILLAPSVSTGYDVRPTLRAAREGVDVFCSKKDWVALGFATRLFGTVDRRWAPAAGRNGFHEPGEGEADGLRQHFWSPEVARTGNTGGHYGTHAPAFIQTYLFPLMDGRQ